MLVQLGLCQPCSKTTLYVFSWAAHTLVSRFIFSCTVCFLMRGSHTCLTLQDLQQTVVLIRVFFCNNLFTLPCWTQCGTGKKQESLLKSLQLNSFTPGVPFMGHRQTPNSIAPDVTPQNAASHLGLFCLLGGISSKNEIKIKNHS